MRLNLLPLAVFASCCWAAAEPALPPNHWRYAGYETETPMLENPLKDAKLSVSGQWSDRGPHFITDGKIEANNHWACEKLPAVLTITAQGS